jgi:hypothetical protein
MTLDEWKTLQPGMMIYTKKSNKPREVIDFNSRTLCAKFKPLRESVFSLNGFVVYAQNDKYLFSLTKSEQEIKDDAI